MEGRGLYGSILSLALKNRFLVFLAVLLLTLWGLSVSPFGSGSSLLPGNPVPVDAIPDLSENQQIVFSEWPGRSPRDVEDQISYPLTVSLMGMPGVRTVRSYSMTGFSTLYVIFEEGVDFYWARSRVLEKLASLPAGSLPEGVSPTLGPDATALGQIFWYTLEGRDAEGQPVGGWDPDELRSVQDYQVRYALLSADGVAEVASVGGYVREYQVDVDPEALRAWDVSLEEVARAIRQSNRDVGARTLEVNSVEYLVRGLGRIDSLNDLEHTVVKAREGSPVLLRDLASLTLGPAGRRGVLDRDGVEAVGGVVVVRFGENPLEAIQNVKERIAEISAGLPEKNLDDGRVSKLHIVPFYDRTQLIEETLGTLESALEEEVLVTLLVVLVLLAHLGSSLLVAALLPLAVLMSFIGMKLFAVDANIVALSGIAIAIGTMVDMGIVVSENILRRVREAGESSLELILDASREVGSAVLTAVSTTVISFLPVFALQDAEGKLFRPLAFTKTFALLAAAILALLFLPPFLSFLHGRVRSSNTTSAISRYARYLLLILAAGFLAGTWLPLGVERGLLLNLLFVVLLVGGILSLFTVIRKRYKRTLRWCLDHKVLFLTLPLLILALGLFSWRSLGREFMPPLDEGSFLYMPTTMPHASLGETLDILQKQDLSMSMIPELETVVGKIGRAETALDPAPLSMVETVIQYHPEFLQDEKGRRLRFAHDRKERDLFRNVEGGSLLAPDGEPYTVQGRFKRDEEGRLVPDRRGRPFRLWRPELDPALNSGRKAWTGIQEPDDIWSEVLVATEIPGSTSAPKLQPIQTRLVMLQSGMRAPLGIKIQGPDLESMESFALSAEEVLRTSSAVNAATVNADRVVGKPYLEIHLLREDMARYGLSVARVQDTIEIALGGRPLTRTLEGRESYPVRLRYARERRDSFEAIGDLLVDTPSGARIPLAQISDIQYRRGPQVIKSEDGFLVSYLLFSGRKGLSEVEVVEECRDLLESKIADGSLPLPAGVHYRFAGTYENQLRASARLRLLVPLSLVLIFALLYLQFRSVAVALMVFSGVAVAWSGGFLMLGFYGLEFLPDFLRDMLHLRTVNLSVAVWVGFLALFGIATDDGVLMATYLRQGFQSRQAENREEVRKRVIEGASLRVRPALMTTATTLIALLPILSSTGRGSDIMIPMAIPVFGGMVVALATLFMVPVLYSLREEKRLSR